MTPFDSDTLTYFLQDKGKIAERLRKHDEAPAIPVVVLAEALRGRSEAVLKAANGEQLRSAAKLFADDLEALHQFVVVPVCQQAADHLDQLRKLRGKNKPNLGHADLMIACIALANNALLVTRNTRHFKSVPNLRIENWYD